MAVRFLPPPEDRPAGGEESRADLAEVIELRSLLGGRGWGEAGESAAQSADIGAAGGAESEGGAETEGGTESEGEACTEASTAAEPPAGPRRIVNIDAFRDGSRAAEAEMPEAEMPEAEPVEATTDESDRSSAYDDGVRVLARRARSSGELRDELQRLEHPAHEVEAVIDEFEQSHYLDDAGLARAVTEKLRETKRASRAQIRVKLRERRLPDAIIEAALGELDVDEEFALLRETAQDRARKLGGLDRQTAERRLLGFLARRGWSGEPAMRAAREALDGGASGGSGVRFR
ncbi:regulatory protein RecX [Leucobacter chironomi]|uniref:regulatory protein RecX n=1 Tax=Leucobacter chironomi TaxID=491918 RepID=UPI0012679A3C|nr:regulatory protein RecX [Leucobacter chironomi]